MKFITMQDALKEAFLDIELAKIHQKVVGYVTGFPRLNDKLGGAVKKSKMITIAARPSCGKSALANQLAHDLIVLNRDRSPVVIYWNFELTAAAQALRFLSFRSQLYNMELTNYKTKTFKLKDESEISAKEGWEKLTAAKDSLMNLEIYFQDIPRTPKEIYNAVETLSEKFKDRDIINIYDHALLVKGNQGQERAQKLEEFFGTAIEIKKNFKTIEIILTQLSREHTKDYRQSKKYFLPTMADLFGSDSGAQAGDNVLLLSRPEREGFREIELDNFLFEDLAGKVFYNLDKARDGAATLGLFEVDFCTYTYKEVEDLTKYLKK